MLAIITFAFLAGCVSAGGVADELVVGQKHISDGILPQKAIVDYNTHSSMNWNRGAHLIGTGGQRVITDTLAQKWKLKQSPVHTVTVIGGQGQNFGGHLTGQNFVRDETFNQKWKIDRAPIQVVTTNLIAGKGKNFGGHLSGQKFIKDRSHNEWKITRVPIRDQEVTVTTRKNYAFGAPFVGRKSFGEKTYAGQWRVNGAPYQRRAYDQSYSQNWQSWKNKNYQGAPWSFSGEHNTRVPGIAYTYVKPAFSSTPYGYYSGEGVNTGLVYGRDSETLREKEIHAPRGIERSINAPLGVDRSINRSDFARVRADEE